jgi:predicted enzyme related to lactoylglutathione lyase
VIPRLYVSSTLNSSDGTAGPGESELCPDRHRRGGGHRGRLGEAQGPNQVTFYIEVDDSQAYLDRIETAGGKTVIPVTEVPDMVTFAQFSDP